FIAKSGIVRDAPPSEDKECLICNEPIEPGNSVSLPCNHKFCFDCFVRHISIKFLEGKAQFGINCPQANCTAKIYPSKVREVFLITGVTDFSKGGRVIPGEVAVEQFTRLIQEDFIRSKKGSMCYCPHPTCNYVAIRKDLLRKDVRCLCGNTFCFQCGHELHVPATCEMMEDWDKLNNSQSLDDIWIEANTKPCPRCNAPIEKTKGCLRMVCRCSYIFCWDCKKDWKKTHDENRHFFCTTPENQRPSLLESMKAKDFIEYKNLYSSRLDDHKKLVAQARKQLAEIHQKIDAYKQCNKCDDMTAEFIRDCAATLVKCREFLLNSIILGFFSKTSKAKEFFDYQQKELQMSIEELSKLMELPAAQIERMEMMHISTISIQHLEKLIKHFSEDGLERLQESEQPKQLENEITIQWK
ncbi:MAG: putative E3 ubiquitin-protein ligase dbl4, partial [Streblomastix strix]